MHRRTPAALLVSTLALSGLAVAGLAPPASAAGPKVVSLTPTDRDTVSDPRQTTGRRVALPTPACATEAVTVCGLQQRVDELDGFDLDPRIAVRFDGPVDVDDAVASITVRPRGNGQPVFGVDRAVYDAATHTVYVHPRHQLQPSTTYQLKVTTKRGLSTAQTLFTTGSATDGLLDQRRQLDSGTAFAAAGIGAADRGLRVDAVVPADGTTLAYTEDTGAELKTVPVPSAAAGTLVFGSYLAPSWLRADGTIEHTPTGDAGPAALGAVRLPFLAVLPPGTAPAGGWPTAVYGHGFTRSDADVLLAAAVSSRQGVATIATDVVGHGYGPRSTWSVTRGGTTTTLPAYARGHDVDGNGTIDYTEGSSTLATGPAAAVGSSDALRQTVSDISTLVRDIGLGADLDGTAGVDLRPTDVTYFGQSFGGIYGTMLAGSDPAVARSVLNVAGGPITEVVRLGGFRPIEGQALQIAGLLNSTDPARSGFDESLPLRGDAPVTNPAPGALAIQDFLAQTTWLNRSGSPETFAPLVRRDRALFQVAYGDQTVPNPTAYTLLDSGDLFGRASLYRDDKDTTDDGTNPHGFLLNLTGFPTASLQGQAQVVAFLRDGLTVDPDGAGPVWEVPVRWKRSLLGLNYDNPAFPES